ncbi:sterol uptake control 2 [Fusarium beomiforme]|uniref:Sterol uptake control 2 n=1 Tax=Fusarium beomiforme TaxID=44412 RepID=A0A9P5ABH0_9HYPO|nr:sterol uptake control 2 [Fusarium beomiforme]
MPPSRKTRARTGCMTCRMRKVKCDESKPFCDNCRRVNKACVYQQPQYINYPEKRQPENRGDETNWRALNDPGSVVNPTTEDRGSNISSTPQAPGPLTEGDIGYPDFSWGEWGDPFPSAAFGQDIQDLLLQTSPGQRSLPSDIFPDPSSTYSFFLSTVNPPFITPWDLMNWNIAKDYLCHLATTTPAISAAIQAVETLYQSLLDDGDISPGLSRYFAAKTLYISLQSDFTCDLELVLITGFLLACFEVVVQQETVPSLLKQEGMLIKRLEECAEPQTWSPLARRIISWLYLFHTKAMHLGGLGILSPKVINLLRKSHHISSLTCLRVGHAAANEAVNDAIQQSLFHFYFELQDISLQVSCLNRHHRSRGTLKDETDVDTISKTLEKQLQCLWEGRPLFIDAVENEGISAAPQEPTRLSELNLVACLCRICYHAEIIYHARAYGRAQPLSPSIVNARAAIRQGIEQVSCMQTLHPAFIWPLFLYAVETMDDDDLEWVLATLQGISDPWWNSQMITDLASGVGREQLRKSERVDSRYLCLERFGTVPPYM